MIDSNASTNIIKENTLLKQEIRELKQELKETRKKAERAEHAKELFLANISHELRTPLNGIIGFASLLKDSGLVGTEKNQANIIYHSAHSLLGTLNNIIDLSILASKNFKLREKPFDFRKAIHVSLKQAELNAQRKGIRLTGSISAEVEETLIADKNRIQQMLFHLLDNAIKFTETGTVSLKVTTAPRAEDHVLITFCVEDTGIGIRKERIEQLIQPFEQADPSGTRRYGGLGIGLTLIKSLCDYMNGSFKIESKEDEGTTVFVSFTARIQQAADETDDITKNKPA